jgi:hypothetical protein
MKKDATLPPAPALSSLMSVTPRESRIVDKPRPPEVGEVVVYCGPDSGRQFAGVVKLVSPFGASILFDDHLDSEIFIPEDEYKYLSPLPTRWRTWEVTWKVEF